MAIGKGRRNYRARKYALLGCSFPAAEGTGTPLQVLLETKEDESGNVKCHEARFLVCENEENENDEVCFSPVTDYTVIKFHL